MNRCSMNMRLTGSRLIHLVILCLTAFIFSLSTVAADEVKITHVLDSNLFELKDGRRVRLANVLTPSTSDSNRRVAIFAYRVKKYAEEQLLNQTVVVEFLRGEQADSAPLPVHLFQKFPLKTVCYNKVYLERGFGKFIEEADTMHRAAYLRAESKARKKKRGVWSEHFYEPAPPGLHAHTILLGLGNSRNSEGFYREVFYSSDPLEPYSGLGFRVMAVFGRQALEYDGYRNALLFLTVSPYYTVDSRYFGFRLGSILIFPTGVETPDFLFFPNGQIKIGQLHRFYLSIDVLTDLVFSPASIGINFLREKPYRKLWIGVTPSFVNLANVAFKVDYLFREKLLFKLQGIYFHYVPDNGTNIAENNFGFRLGIGFVFR